MFMVLLSGFFALLARYSGQTDFAVGTPSTSRSDSGTETIIGFFVNTLVLRADLSGDPTGRQLLERVRSVVLEARDNQQVPLNRVIEALQPERSLGLNPLFQVIFAWQRAAAAMPDFRDIEATPVTVESGISIVDLSLTMQDLGHTIVGEFEYRSDLFDVDRIARMEGHYVTLLAEFAADPGRTLFSLPLFTFEERRQLLSEWNHPVTTVRKACLHSRRTKRRMRSLLRKEADS
jgi:non-ribosomal peptide synthetase component F